MNWMSLRRMLVFMVGVLTLIAIIYIISGIQWSEKESYLKLPFLIAALGLIISLMASLSYSIRKGAIFTWSSGDNKIHEKKFEKYFARTGMTLFVLGIIAYLIVFYTFN